MTKQIITAETVRLAWKAGESVIVYAKGDIVTQQAQDDARHYGITLTTETPVAPSSALAEPEAEAVPPVPPVLEEVPASQEPVHVPTPALTADQLAAAARQLQEALVPLTQALTASVARRRSRCLRSCSPPAATPWPPRPWRLPPLAEQRSDDSSLVAIRRGVLSALPHRDRRRSVDRSLDRIRPAEMGACSAPETRPGVRQAGGVTHVDSKAQYWEAPGRRAAWPSWTCFPRQRGCRLRGLSGLGKPLVFLDVPAYGSARRAGRRLEPEH